MAKALLYHADPTTSNASGSTTLKTAAETGKGDMIRQLLAKDVDCKFRNDDRGTALVKAMKFGHTGVVRVPLNHGVDHQVQYATVTTMLHTVCSCKNTKPDMIKILLQTELHTGS